ncbi:uncharacterized protein MELLADRAFT_107697 [Melampsora larici-populina 98AG31]|uniref:Sugar phosphate phosphatase n=2 Tax=Melampsora larici-populina (strain 98AG31 / pathotype 3-4-7) TaxID=747676 RepID=F4RQH0_MELLP|nr:uncharacterized protein MELLADRAFT_107697 [Melampsora larici-populina 98AG31]EGG05411.1 hypothetical protein MELLADRAFT_107697 [Melampsora larici-populina 98AG31]
MTTTRFPNSSYQPPVRFSIEPYSASNPNTFAYQSTIKRWPMILTNIIDRMVKINNSLLDEGGDHQNDKLKHGKLIISQISELKYQCARDKELGPIIDDGGQNLVLYNEELKKAKAANKSTWFTASWLFAECYLYRRLNSFFMSSEHWKTYDPFHEPKTSCLQASFPAILKLATTLNLSISNLDPINEDQLRTSFRGFLLASLWGNATDLSLLPTISSEAIYELQSENRSDSSRILKDDFETLYKRMNENLNHKKENGYEDVKRIDIVLDNAGFELFTDLVLADWFISISPFATKVVFHPKDIPWFVSDVMEKDIKGLLEALIEYNDVEVLEPLVKRWKEHFVTKKWEIAHEYTSVWTSPFPFWDLPNQSQELWKDLKSSDLVIFKGDLNYRKLTGDANWETTVRFEDSIGPLESLINLLSLRTCKADVVVGLRNGLQKEMDETDPEWRINGKYGMISFSKQEP